MRVELVTRQCKTHILCEEEVVKIQTTAQNGCRQARASGSQENVDYPARRIPSNVAYGITLHVGIPHLRRLEEVGYVTDVA